jgi:hypothetical protein
MNAPNASGVWNSPTNGIGVNINDGAIFNHDGGTLIGAPRIGPENATDFQVFNNITITTAGSSPFIFTRNLVIEGTVNISTGSWAFAFATAAPSVRTIRLGTATSAGVIQGNTSTRFAAGSQAITITFEAVNPAFPWTLAGALPNQENAAGGKTIDFMNGIVSSTITTGVAFNDTFIANNMTFNGLVTVSSGDTWDDSSCTNLYAGGLVINAGATLIRCAKKKNLGTQTEDSDIVFPPEMTVN